MMGKNFTDTCVENNGLYAQAFDQGALPAPPARKAAIVACMDARMHVAKLLGLKEGDAHVIRNAGGVVTDDVLRSLVISQRLLGSEEILLLHHTQCGMLTFRDDEVKDAIERDTGLRPSFSLEAFPNLDENVRQSMRRIHACPFIPVKDKIRGFIYEVESGLLREVPA